MNRVLVVAFDGLDYELIQEYGLENIPQKEFGKIDNKEGMTALVTSELFASFITGKTWKEHGIVGLNKPKNKILRKIEHLNKFYFFRKFKGLRRRLYKEIPFLDDEIVKYTKEDVKADTIFEEIPNSKAISVPSYNKGYNIELLQSLTNFGIEDAMRDQERFTKWKKWELFEALEMDYDFIMTHFHEPDHIHHWFWEIGRMEKVEQTYKKMDDLAGRILDEADDFDYVIFMSDHGLPDPEGDGHNENAFYSCNRELFGDKVPHITDFHDKIIELVGEATLKQSEEIEGLDL